MWLVSSGFNVQTVHAAYALIMCLTSYGIMELSEYHLHNEVGIRFPPLRPTYSDGDLYFGRFRALISRETGMSVIGEGGTGRIHFVRDELMDREVALKIPLESILRDPAAREDVIEETRQAMDLTHPNIVRIHDFHGTDRLWGISMQYVRGKNLDEWRFVDIGKSGSRRTIRPYQVESIQDWIAQLCDALRYAHEDARMVHRDIKPKNLMLERREGGEKLLLTDFGITQRLRQQTLQLSRDQGRAGESKNNMGTLPYMPWDQIAGGPPSPMDDIYAVGATIYDLITGRPPFYEGGFEQIKVQIKETIPPSMEQRLTDFGIPAPHVPREWEEVVEACLAKRPEDRPQSMRELAHALGFQSGSDTALDALVQTQKVRILELEDKIEIISLSTVTDTGQAGRLGELELELTEAREQAAGLEKRARVAEGELATIHARLDLAERQIQDAGKSDDERLKRLREETSRRISELEQSLAKAQADGEKFGQEAAATAEAEVQRLQKELATSRQEAEAHSAKRISGLEAELKAVKAKTRIESEKVAAEFQPRIDALTAKVRTLEAERESAVAGVRQEAEKRLQKQADDLNQIQARLDKEAVRRAKLEQVVDAEKNRQAASLRPIILTLLLALLVGLGGGFYYRKINQPPILDASWVEAQGFPAVSEPVTWGQFKVFAQSSGYSVRDLVAEEVAPGKDADRVEGVTWYVAQRFCEWLTRLEGSGTHQYTLPEFGELIKEVDRWTWTSTYYHVENDDAPSDFIGFKIYDDKDKPVPLYPSGATKDTTFRVIRREK